MSSRGTRDLCADPQPILKEVVSQELSTPTHRCSSAVSTTPACLPAVAARRWAGDSRPFRCLTAQETVEFERLQLTALKDTHNVPRCLPVRSFSEGGAGVDWLILRKRRTGVDFSIAQTSLIRFNYSFKAVHRPSFVGATMR